MTVPKTPIALSRRSGRLWRDVLAAWELSPAEKVVLENGLRSLDRADQAAAVLSDEGISSVDRYGAPRAHPLVDVEVRCRREFASAVRQLGVKLVDEQPTRRRGAKPGPKPKRPPLREVG